MLRELRIQNYAIIDEISLSFSEGFNVITGETGAGKSVLIEALSLLLGGRSSTEEIRQGSEEAVLEACFDPVSPSASADSDLLILKRIVSKSGKNRIYQNGSFANLSILKEIGRSLAEIHGQHEHHGLIDLDRQLDLLDGFGRLMDERSLYGRDYRKWAELIKARTDLEKEQAERGRRESFIQYQLSELREAGLQPEEEESLEKEARFLRNSERILSAIEKAYALLSDEGAVLSQLDEIGIALKELESLTNETAPEAELWETSKIQLKEAAARLRGRLNEKECQPERLGEVTERLYLIQKLKKKYQRSVEELLEYRGQLEADLSQISESETRLKEIEEERAHIEKKVTAGAKALSAERMKTRDRLEKRIREELDALGMEKTKFEISFKNIPLSENGIDQIEFLIALPGEVPQSLAKIASGGELSRIMLALKVVLTAVDPVPTLVFDEVDAGIGGGIAERVGRRLARLAEHHQVFCITHLPQIASLADSHYFVEKKFSDGRAVTSIRKLSREEKIQELARMLGGVTITSITLRHAEEMIQAKEEPGGPTPLQQTKKTKKERNK